MSTPAVAPANGAWDSPEFMQGFPALFRYVQELCLRRGGIHLPDGKKDLVRSRLSKRVRALGLSSFEAYLGVLSGSGRNGEERVALEALTTNLTYFFREPRHFDVLAERAPDWCEEGGRFWSAGCSSGEEPYTIAMVLTRVMEGTSAPSPRILATDLSTRMVSRTREGRYPLERLKGVSVADRGRYFRKDAAGGDAVVSGALRSMVSPARLNLMGPWPMKHRFHGIFCRNVMIYFNMETRERLVRRFHEVLHEDGLLFVGLSESLNSLDVPFRYVEPGVYRPD